MPCAGMGISNAAAIYSFLAFFTVLFRNAPMGIPVDWTSTTLESSSSEISTASVSSVGEGNWTQNIDPETFLELVEDGYQFTQGDIMEQLNRNVYGFAWIGGPGNISVPYEIDDKLAHREKDVLAAFKEITEHSCVKFHARTTEPDYLFFTFAYGCASYLGKIGGQQQVFIGDRCKVGNIVHEIMHALGFHHEHMRMDRDDHVTVIYENIIPEKKRNFAKILGDTQGLPYDTHSIMHYGQRFFSSNGKETLLSKKGKPIGQRIKLSLLDVQRVNLLYKCETGTASPLSTSTVFKATTSAQVSTQSTAAPEKTQTTASSVNTQTTAGPVNTLTTAGPVNTQITTGPMNALTTASPVNTLSTASPVNTLSTASPVNTLSTAGLVNTQTTTGPVNALTTASPVNTLSTVSPVNTLSTASLVNTLSTAGLVNTLSTAGLVNTQTTTGPVNALTTASPVNTLSTASLVNTLSTAGLVNTLSTAGLVNTQTTTGPVNALTTASPVNTLSTVISVNTQTTTGPVNSLTTVSPVNTLSIASPMNSQTTASPVNTHTTAGPVNTQTTAGTVNTLSTAGPTAGPKSTPAEVSPNSTPWN